MLNDTICLQLHWKRSAAATSSPLFLPQRRVTFGKRVLAAERCGCGGDFSLRQQVFISRLLFICLCLLAATSSTAFSLGRLLRTDRCRGNGSKEKKENAGATFRDVNEEVAKHQKLQKKSTAAKKDGALHKHYTKRRNFVTRGLQANCPKRFGAVFHQASADGRAV